MSPSPEITPGENRLVTFHVGQKEFRARRPTRADDREIKRRYVAKLLGVAPPIPDYTSLQVAQGMLEQLDGGDLYAEAQFEVLLLPRRVRGVDASIGEHAPEDWYLRFEDGQGGEARIISFEKVDTAELREAAGKLDEALAAQKKSDQPPSSSTATAKSPNSA